MTQKQANYEFVRNNIILVMLFVLFIAIMTYLGDWAAVAFLVLIVIGYWRYWK